MVPQAERQDDTAATTTGMPSFGVNKTTCKPRGVIGQHIATSVVASAITEHYSAPPNDPPQKPLVLMLFGAPGVGKSYLETTLRKDLFSNANADGDSDGVLVLSGVDFREE